MISIPLETQSSVGQAIQPWKQEGLRQQTERPHQVRNGLEVRAAREARPDQVPVVRQFRADSDRPPARADCGRAVLAPLAINRQTRGRAHDVRDPGEH